MHEAPRWNAERITSIDWVTYPILRFVDAPHVTVIRAHPGKYTVVPHGDMSIDVREGNTRAIANGWLLTGVGEPGSAGIGAAVANAFFDATGVRIRQAPMTPAVARGVLQAAGVK
jgi:CO/xanthine dehydrogenase Mo-binding subunit